MNILSLDSVSLWNSIVDPTDKVVVLLDDCFGKVSVSRNSLDEHSNNLNTIYACIRTGKVKVIMTARINILEDIKGKLQETKLFDKIFDKVVLDLSNEKYALSVDNKEIMLRKHLRSKGIQITLTKSEASKQDTNCIDQFSVRDIAQTTQLNFPLLCYLFCSSQTFLHLGLDYFKRPRQVLLDDINDIRDSGEPFCRIKFCTLVYACMKDGVVDKTDLDSALLQTIVQMFSMVPYSPEKIVFEVSAAVKHLLFTYFKPRKGHDRIYEFVHTSILEAVALSAGQSSAEFVIEHCSPNVLFELLVPDDYNQKENEVVFKVSRKMFDSVSERFFLEILRDERDKRTGIKRILCHRLFNDDIFAEFFVNVLKEKISRDINAEQLAYNSVFTQMFLVACEINRADIVKMISCFNVSVTILNQGFQDSCYYNNQDVTEILIPFVNNIPNSFLHACSFGCLNAMRVLMFYRYVLTQCYPIYKKTTIIVDVDSFEETLLKTTNLPPLLLRVFRKTKYLVRKFVNSYPIFDLKNICWKTVRLAGHFGLALSKIIMLASFLGKDSLSYISEALLRASKVSMVDAERKALLLQNLKFVKNCIQYDKIIKSVCTDLDITTLDVCNVREALIRGNSNDIPSNEVINDIIQSIMHVLHTLTKDEKEYFVQILSWTTRYSYGNPHAAIYDTDICSKLLPQSFKDMMHSPVYIRFGQMDISFDDLKEGLYRSCKAGHDAASSLIIDVFLHFHVQRFTKQQHIDSTADYTSVTNYSIMTRAITETIDIGNYQFALKLITNHQRILRNNDVYIICVHYCYENQTSYAELLLRKLNDLQEDVLAGLLIEHMTCRPLIDTVLRVRPSTFHTPDKFRNITPKEYARKCLSSNGKYILDVLGSYEQHCSQNADNG